MSVGTKTPYSEEAEISVLGSLLISNDSYEKVCNLIIAEDFYIYNHRLIFESIQQLMITSKPVDCLTVHEYMKTHFNQQSLDVGHLQSYLVEVSLNTPTAANILHYAHIVKHFSALRSLIDLGIKVSRLGYEPNNQDYKDLLDQAERTVFSLTGKLKLQNEGEEKNIAAHLPGFLQHVQERFESDGALAGVSTGFTDLDDATCGLQEGQLIIVAGRPAMGKTTFAMNIAEHICIKSELPVLFFSMEMPAYQLLYRLIASLGRIDLKRFISGRLHDEDWPRLATAISLLQDKNLVIKDTGNITPYDIKQIARRQARKYGKLGLIVIDYLQLMSSGAKSENRNQELTEISRALKVLALELKVPIIALSQLNRGVESRMDKRPFMSDLKDSGAIEQDADIVLMIYRDEVYNKESPSKGVAEVIIGKHRNGETGTIKLNFLGKFSRFENLAANPNYPYGAHEYE